MTYFDDVEWGDLAAFRAVAEELSFTAAGRRLHLAQTALSRRVARLEQHLGVSLLVRTTRRVSVTAAGRELLTWLDEVERGWSATRAGILAHRRAPGSPHSVRLGANKVNLGELLPRLTALWPSTQWTTRRMGALDALPELSPGGDLDAYLAVCAPNAPWSRVSGLQERRLVREPMWIALHRDHPAARSGEVNVLELADEDWIIAGEPGAEEAFTATCQAAGFTPRIRHVSDGRETMLALLAEGAGVALSAAMARTLPEVVVLPWRGGPQGDLVLVWHRDEFAPEHADALANCVLGWYRERARQAPRYWQWITKHPDEFSQLLTMGQAAARGASPPD